MRLPEPDYGNTGQNRRGVQRRSANVRKRLFSTPFIPLDIPLRGPRVTSRTGFLELASLMFLVLLAFLLVLGFGFGNQLPLASRMEPSVDTDRHGCGN